ncbi:hypothetical protein SAMN05660703_0275 [Cellulophaga tyrosinoxydans]|uniref:Uncharacterized protein n=1 Tax=Cellulophaga tyrosinoxydans TaxID=504486 RepID=A0A1W1YC36_9FLAO|nr:hypothetical protein SAMN05660703_0275 [Cellulophaga tyrosinoxydans]
MENKPQNHIAEINDMLQIYKKLKVLKMNSNLMNPEEYSLELEILKLSLTLNTEVYENDQLALILRKSGIATNN